MPYGIVLLPIGQAEDFLIARAASLDAGDNVLMRVGPTTPPHVSILHMDCSSGDALGWWGRVLEKVDSVIEVEASCLGLSAIERGNYHVPEGGVYVGLEVLRRRGLEKVNAVSTAEAEEIGGPVLTGFGDGFRPHITLGIFERVPEISSSTLSELLDLTFEMRLALGVLGPYGTFPKILRRAGDV